MFLVPEKLVAERKFDRVGVREILVANFQLHFAALHGDLFDIDALHLRPRVAGVGEVAGIHQIVALAVDVEGAVVKEKVERRVGVVTRLQQYRDMVVEDAVLEHHLAVHR